MHPLFFQWPKLNQFLWQPVGDEIKNQAYLPTILINQNLTYQLDQPKKQHRQELQLVPIHF